MMMVTGGIDDDNSKMCQTASKSAHTPSPARVLGPLWRQTIARTANMADFRRSLGGTTRSGDAKLAKSKMRSRTYITTHSLIKILFMGSSN